VSTQLTLSSNEGVFAESIRLFPNPSSAFIEVSGLSQSEEYIIYNTLGKEVSSGVISANEKIDVGEFHQEIPQQDFDGCRSDGRTDTAQ
jgi:hypothetical protein